MTRAEFDRLMAAQAQAEAASNPMFGGDMTQVSGFGVGGFGGGLGTFNPAALQRFPTTIPGSQAVAAGTLVPGFGVLPPYVSPSGPLITTPGLGVFPQNNAFATDFNGFVGQSLAPSAFNGFAGQSPAPSTANPVTINGANLNVASPIPSIPPATQNPPGHR